MRITTERLPHLNQVSKGRLGEIVAIKLESHQFTAAELAWLAEEAGNSRKFGEKDLSEMFSDLTSMSLLQLPSLLVLC